MADETLPTAAPADGDPSQERGSSTKRIAPFVVGAVALAMAGLLYVLVAADPGPNATADTPLLGQPAPPSVGTLDDGGTFELSRRRGSWVVLNFFTHNCDPCIREHPELIEFVDQQRALGTQGAEFYTVVQHSSREQIEAFFAERGGDWPIVYDDRFEFQNDFGVAQVPETWIIDPNGYVQARIISEVDAQGLSRILQQIREAMR